MKLIDLLHPDLPLPWQDVPIGPGDIATKDALFLLRDGAFATELVLPIGSVGQTYSTPLTSRALRKNQIVIHTDGRKTSLHFVADEVMGAPPMVVPTSDYVLRLNPANRVSPAAIFAQLFNLWKGVSVNKDTPEGLIRDTEIAPVGEAGEVVAEEAIAILVRAQAHVRRAENLRGEARECLAMLGAVTA